VELLVGDVSIASDGPIQLIGFPPHPAIAELAAEMWSSSDKMDSFTASTPSASTLALVPDILSPPLVSDDSSPVPAVGHSSPNPLIGSGSLFSQSESDD
jgi:hypothetical protein